MTWQQKVARMREIERRMTQINDGAAGRALAPAAQREFDGLVEEFEGLDRDRHLDEVRSLALGGSVEGPEQPGQRRRRTGTDPVVGRAYDVLDTLERSYDGIVSRSGLDQYASLLDNQAEGRATAELLSVAGDPNYFSAWASLVADPETGGLGWSPEERAAFRRARDYQATRAAMSLTAGEGGYLVPSVVDPSLILTSTGQSANELRLVARVEQIVVGTWKGVASAGVTAEYAAENAEVALNTPAFTQPTVTSMRGDAYVEASYEVAADAPAFISVVSQMLIDAKDRLEAEKMGVTGTGTNEPVGLVAGLVAANKKVSSATVNVFAIADVYATVAAVPARWRSAATCGWFSSDLTYNLVRRFAESTGPGSAFWADLGGGQPPLLLGKPTVANAYMGSDPNATADAGAARSDAMLVYGDFKQFVIVDRLGPTLELNSVLGANRRPVGRRGFTLWFRSGSGFAASDGFRVLMA